MLNVYGNTAVKMQVEFCDFLEIEPTWLRLFEWAEVVKTNDFNIPWNPQIPNLKFQKLKTTAAWKCCSKKDQLLKRWLTNYWITSQNGTPWNYFLMLLVYEYFPMLVCLLFYNKGEQEYAPVWACAWNLKPFVTLYLEEIKHNPSIILIFNYFVSFQCFHNMSKQLLAPRGLTGLSVFKLLLCDY